MIFLGTLLLPALLACPGGADHGLVTNPPSGDPIGFQFNGQTQAVAGSWGTSWQILTSPQVFGGNRLHFSGPGTLTDDSRNPLDLTRSDLSAEGWYIPPATVPAGGATVTLSMEAYWQLTKQWVSSPNYTIRVVQQTTPMNYTVDPRSTSSATLHAGQTTTFGGIVTPRPVDFQQHFVIIPSQSTTADLGTATLTTFPLSSGEWGVDYKAPLVITAPMDITVRAIAHDPWFNLDPQVDFTVHLVPN